jgi:serine/threonine-protein kinase HipA
VVAGELAVWLYGTCVAVLDQVRGLPRLAYTDDALRMCPAGSPLLSLALPVRTERYPHGVVRSFLDGLLPEAEARRLIARDLGVPNDDTYELIGALGRDCAGAIVIQPAEEIGPPPSSTASADPLDDDSLLELVMNLQRAPLGVGGRVRISLAGVQEKLVLTRMPSGGWGRPIDGTPSTHILKPEVAGYRDTVRNEAFSMSVARHLGLDVANFEMAEIGGREVIVVERFDRSVGSDGSVERIHQEDFCQATGTPPSRKYEDDEGPSLRTIANILSTAAVRGSTEMLVRAVTFEALIGNGDAHAKNFSLLHDHSGALRLAPLYDLMCTLYYGDDQLAMYIDDVRRTDKVTAERIVNEASSWGMSPSRAERAVQDILERAPEAIRIARSEIEVPAALVAVVESQLDRLWRG